MYEILTNPKRSSCPTRPNIFLTTRNDDENKIKMPITVATLKAFDSQILSPFLLLLPGALRAKSPAFLLLKSVLLPHSD
jgi:hypothetical protein